MAVGSAAPTKDISDAGGLNFYDKNRDFSDKIKARSAALLAAKKLKQQ